MPKNRKRLVTLGLVAIALLAAPGVAWISLSYQPKFYRARAGVPRAQQQQVARRFVAQSLQLRNDICNEPRWEAVFTDQEVNAWLAEDLVTHFADQIPTGVHEPRVLFEDGRATLAFQLDRGPVRSVVWVVVRVRVPEPNQLALTVEKIRAGIVPVAAEHIIDRLTEQARQRGLDVRWEADGDLPVAIIRYTPDLVRSDVVLESLLIRDGEVRLAGRSNRVQGAVVTPTLPSRRVLQSKFPRRNAHGRDEPESSPSSLRNSPTPTS